MINKNPVAHVCNLKCHAYESHAYIQMENQLFLMLLLIIEKKLSEVGFRETSISNLWNCGEAMYLIHKNKKSVNTSSSSYGSKCYYLHITGMRKSYSCFLQQ